MGIPAKESYRLDEAAKRLSAVFNDSIAERDLLEWALQGKLRISIKFNAAVQATIREELDITEEIRAWLSEPELPNQKLTIFQKDGKEFVAVETSTVASTTKIYDLDLQPPLNAFCWNAARAAIQRMAGEPVVHDSRSTPLSYFIAQECGSGVPYDLGPGGESLPEYSILLVRDDELRSFVQRERMVAQIGGTAFRINSIEDESAPQPSAVISAAEWDMLEENEEAARKDPRYRVLYDYAAKLYDERNQLLERSRQGLPADLQVKQRLSEIRAELALLDKVDESNRPDNERQVALVKPVATEEPQPSLTSKNESDQKKTAYFATKEEILAAFGCRPDLFDDGHKHDWYLKARVKGRGGRRSIEPKFDPFLFAEHLPETTYGKGITKRNAWRILEKHFPDRYAEVEAFDPREKA